MGWLLDKLEEWVRGLLVDSIEGNLRGMFGDVNTKVSSIAGDVGKTPANWNGTIFSMIRDISDAVIIPIAGMIITFVLVYELVNMIMEKNNMQDRVFYKGC
jgi:hypothetical protein